MHGPINIRCRWMFSKRKKPTKKQSSQESRQYIQSETEVNMIKKAWNRARYKTMMNPNRVEWSLLDACKVTNNDADKDGTSHILQLVEVIHVARMGEERGAYRVLVGKPEGKRPLGRPGRRWVDNIRMDLQEVGCGYVDWIGLAQDRDRWRTLVSVVTNLLVP